MRINNDFKDFFITHKEESIAAEKPNIKDNLLLSFKDSPLRFKTIKEGEIPSFINKISQSPNLDSHHINPYKALNILNSPQTTYINSLNIKAIKDQVLYSTLNLSNQQAKHNAPSLILNQPIVLQTTQHIKEQQNV